MSQSIVDRKRAFALLPPMRALQAVRCGFELETQRVDGSTYAELAAPADDSEGDFDEDGWMNAVSSNVDRFFSTSELLWLIVRRRADNELHRIRGLDLRYAGRLWPLLVQLADAYIASRPNAAELTLLDQSNAEDWARGIRLTFDDLVDAVPDEQFPHVDEVRSEVQDYWEERTERSPYYSEPESSGEVDLDVPRGLEAKADSSVEGVEFIVAGSGTDAPHFIRLLRALVAQFELDVDAACSFHVHVSVPGITHSYGPLLQCHLMEYLLTNVHRLPEGVRERWSASTQYFRPRISQEKYSFVHFHERCRTWEFRCFGNVNTVKDGVACLRLAVEALQFAYRVSLGLATSLFTHESQWDESLFRGVIGRDESLPVVAKAQRTRRREQLDTAA